jgi:hypothetical protein
MKPMRLLEGLCALLCTVIENGYGAVGQSLRRLDTAGIRGTWLGVDLEFAHRSP